MEPLLRAINLSKSLGTLPVVQNVSLEIEAGEVVGLAGQSGAGKSALCMLLAGFHVPNGGDLYFDGERLRWPFQGRALGIEIIHQHPDMAERLDISSNVFLGNEIGWSLAGKWLKIPNRRRMDREAVRILSQLGMRFDSPRESLDDPTLALGYPYIQRLFALIQTWQQQGTAVFFASDNLDHLLAVTDRIVILRHGRCIAEFRTDEADREELVAAMVGATDRQQLTPIVWALDSYYRAREQAEKLHQRQAHLARDLGVQDILNRELLDQMVTQIDALDSANVALQDAQRRLLTELEQERKHLAREIHDEVIQDLLGVSYQLEELEADRVETPALRKELGAIRANIRGLVDDLRLICGSLRPPTIDSLGLGPTIQSYTRGWTRRTNISVVLDLDPNLGRLPETIELSIFRMIQEGLSNVHKHTSAGEVQISLRHTTPRTLMLSISDDGQGLPEEFDLSTLYAQGHYGLLGLSERVALLGGRSRVQNQAGGGVLVQAEIPHPRMTQTEEDW